LQRNEPYGFLDLLVSVLAEHEKTLSELIDRLEKATRILELLPVWGHEGPEPGS